MCFSLANITMNTETILKCSAERLQGIHLTWLGLCQLEESVLQLSRFLYRVSQRRKQGTNQEVTG